MEKLKKCPFCGGAVRPMFLNEEGNECVYEGDEEEIQFFKCYGCDTEFIHSEPIDNPQTQIEWWNRRATDADSN